MIRLGLCSGACITRDIPGVIAAAVAAHLDAVEWAADLHIGPGAEEVAGKAMMDTLTAGLTTASYATLYQAGGEDDGHKRFNALLGIASLLQTPIMRVYAYAEHRQASEPGRIEALASELRRLGDLAAGKGITLCLSMGRGTYLDGYERAFGLVEATKHSFVQLAWEDLPSARAESATASLEDRSRLAGLLVARCAGRDGKARSVEAEKDAWRSRLGAFKLAERDPKMGRFVFLGATRAEGNEGTASLAADADALRALVDEIEPRKKR
jgi:hypothetical protein